MSDATTNDAAQIAEQLLGFKTYEIGDKSKKKQITAFRGKHPVIAELLDTYYGDEIYHEGFMLKPFVRNNDEQIDFVTDKLQRDPEVLIIAKEYCALVNKLLN